MNKSVTIDLWQTIIGEKDFSSFSKKRRELKCQNAHEYLLQFSNQITLKQVTKSHDFVVDEIAKFSRFHSDKFFLDWLLIFLNKIDLSLINNMKEKEILTFGDVIDEAFLENPPDLYDGTNNFIDFCKSREIKIGIISNTGFNSPKVYRKFLHNNNVEYDAISLSNELGTAKPNSKIFHSTLHSLNSNPKDVIHFGDNPVADILGALNVGMSAVLISKNGEKSPVNNSHMAVINDISFAIDIISFWRQ